MKMILIYATKPEIKALALVKDRSDAVEKITEKQIQAEDRHGRAQEMAKETGGTVSTLALTQWASARCAEVEIELDR